MTVEELQQLPIGSFLKVGNMYWVVRGHHSGSLLVDQDISGWPDPGWRLEQFGLRRYIDRHCRYTDLAQADYPVRRVA